MLINLAKLANAIELSLLGWLIEIGTPLLLSSTRGISIGIWANNGKSFSLANVCQPPLPKISYFLLGISGGINTDILSTIPSKGTPSCLNIANPLRASCKDTC